VVNTSPQPVEATISLYDNAGDLVTVTPLSLGGFSGLRQDLSGLAPANAAFEGYAIVQTADRFLFASGALVGFETYRNQSDLAVMRGIPVLARIKKAAWSHFVSQGGYSSRLTLINASDSSQFLQIKD